jgi:hypothetical protein
MRSLLQNYGQSLIGLSGQLEEYVFDLEEYCFDVRTYNLLRDARMFPTERLGEPEEFGSQGSQHDRCACAHSVAERQAGVYIL